MFVYHWQNDICYPCLMTSWRYIEGGNGTELARDDIARVCDI